MDIQSPHKNTWPHTNESKISASHGHIPYLSMERCFQRELRYRWGNFLAVFVQCKHGFHIHEKGDCSAPDAMSAAGHFNPDGKPHGSPGGSHSHAGDLPNLKADANGNANYSAKVHGITVNTGPAGIVGRSVVIHRDPDDYKSQPAGNSGPRIACGLIRSS
ncbi:MAG: hypothetical protein RLZZ119_960 [Pseudomonadota bacterium]